MLYDTQHRRASSTSQPSSSGYPQRLFTPSLSADEFEMSPGPLGLRTLDTRADPYLEIVFVHGFMGDSNLTWTHARDREMFWPEWLLDEIELSGARLHLYGYQEPAINGRAPVSKVRDIGIALCAALDLSQALRTEPRHPIIFVAHSLGGLVVKAAIESAKRNARFADLYRRFYGVVFLATPHRDTDDRRMLSGILESCSTTTSIHGPTEPEPNTSVLQEIQYSFFSTLQDLKIYSIYGSVDIMVDAKRATLSTEHEPIRVNADHATVAQFQSSSDPSYIAIRDIMIVMANDIHYQLRSGDNMAEDMRALALYLDISDTEDEDLAQSEETRVAGSCEWLLQTQTFTAWRDGGGGYNARPNQVYFLSGDPGCGKSKLASCVVTHLQERQCDCSYFFLKHGDIAKQSIGTLLKSIAYQMACLSPNARQSLLAMHRDGTLTALPTDVRSIWKQIFVQRIFRVEPERHQYWVIDALDEAKAGHEVFGLLQGLPEHYSVFITSRKERDMERALRHIKVIQHEIAKEDTLKDIRTYLEHNEADLHVDEAPQKQMLIQRLVEKSKGSFLWIKLILQELADQWTEDGIDTVLNNVPDGMHHLYSRILRKISQSANGSLARAILQWVICAIRPMSVIELRTAIRLDTDRTLSKSAEAIHSICEPLVRVSASNNRVEVVHDTVREHLFFNRDLPSGTDAPLDFHFDRAASHEHIATVCVNFLVQSLRGASRTLGGEVRSAADDEQFLAYASFNFSEHVVKSKSAHESRNTELLLDSLFEFFQGPLLLWIQRLAEQRSLATLKRTGENLKAYVARRNWGLTHLTHRLHDLHGWADDLIHLVTAFGRELYKDPKAIQVAIPPLCPPQSKIYSELRNQEVGLQVIGLSQTTWPDHISSSSFGRDYAIALACCEKRYAVSLRSSQIVLYYTTTCQEARRIHTTEAIRLMEFATVKGWLVASGRTTLTMFNYESGDTIWTTPTTAEIMALAIPVNDSCIIAVTREKAVETFNLRHGERMECQSLVPRKSRPPMQVHLSHEMKLIAVIYRHEPLELYDLETLLRPKGRISYSANIETIAFNPTLNRLAMAAFDGELSTVELFGLRKIERTEADASHLAVSSDGKTLIVGTKAGDIQIRDFESLAILHTISYQEEEFMGLCFTSNSHRFVDIRRQVFNVWEPAALVRRSEDDEASSNDGRTAFSTAPSELMQAIISADTSPITAIAEHHSGDYVFCAKENSSVVVYETANGKPKQKLFDLGRTEVLFMAWNQCRQLLACADNSSNVRVHHVQQIHEKRSAGIVKSSWQIEEVFPKRSLQQPIRQVLLSLDGEFLLACTATKNYVFRTSGGAPVLVNDCNRISPGLERAQKWGVFWRRKTQIFEVMTGSQTIVWDKDGSKLRLEDMPATDATVANGEPQGQKPYIVRLGSLLWAANDTNAHTAPVLWPQMTAALPPDAAAKVAAHTITEFNKIADQIDALLGLYRGRLIFVSADHWVSSVRIDKSKEPVVCHFPVPQAWRRANRPLKGLISSKGDVIFSVEGDLVVIKNGL